MTEVNHGLFEDDDLHDRIRALYLRRGDAARGRFSGTSP
jgi:hypothetical protein